MRFTPPSALTARRLCALTTFYTLVVRLIAAGGKASTANDAVILTHVSRYRPPTFHVQAWYDEVKDYTFPYPQECNPYCPFRCSGPVCTHYTQVNTPRIGLLHCDILVSKPLFSELLIICCCCSSSFNLFSAAGLGHQQSDWLRRQFVLQYERVGADLGQSRLSCLQLLPKVSQHGLIIGTHLLVLDGDLRCLS